MPEITKYEYHKQEGSDKRYDRSKKNAMFSEIFC